MKNHNNILDIPLIQSEIGSRHRKFIKEYGSASVKVISDHRLFMDIVMAKVNRILLIFREENVIDEIKDIESGPYKKICISKINNPTYVNLSTNGTIILLEGFTYYAGFDPDFQWPKERFFKVNHDDFSWVDFSSKLLNYIHMTIYDRKEAMETRLRGMFEKEELEKNVIVSTIKKKNGNQNV